MSELKPIEAGCMAVITKGEQSGLFLRVSHYIGKLKDFADKDLWGVDKSLTFETSNKFFSYESGYKFCPESMMLRIDDPDLKDISEIREIIDTADGMAYINN